jgi:Rab-like protein 2
MHPSYYFRAHACILVFDVTRKVTYQHLQEWYDELQQFRPGLPTLVVANKIDVDMNVTKQSFKFPLKNPACHPNVYFCSASDGSNVVKVFQTCIQAALEYKMDPNATDFQESVMETLDYFKSKETTATDAPAAAVGSAPAKKQ